MKILFLTLCVALFSVGAFAQEKGEMAAGGVLNYNTDASMVGIGARFQYFFIDNLRGDAEFDYFLKKDGVSTFGLMASAHYLFPINEQFAVFPLAGFGFQSVKIDGIDMHVGNVHVESDSSTTTDWVGQVGGGVQYFFTEKLGGTAEVKYQFHDSGAVVLAAGVIYKF